MSRTIAIAKVENLLEQLRANPDGFFSPIEQKKRPKSYTGAKFFDLLSNYKIGRGGVEKRFLWCSFDNIPLKSGIKDPASMTGDNNYEASRMTVSTTISMSGVLGEFMMELNKQYLKVVKAAVDAGVIVQGSRRLHSLGIQDKVSEEAKENPGAPIDDPILRLKIDFRNYPAQHPTSVLRGRPKTVIKDATKPKIDKRTGKTIDFEPATVLNKETGKEEPLTADNVHEFVTEGSVIVRGSFSVPSVVSSASWISSPIIAHELVIARGIRSTIESEAAKDDLDELLTTVGVNNSPANEPESQTAGDDDADGIEFDV